MQSAKYELSVFINCPFDAKYRTTLLPAIIFTIHDCGFQARSALEEDDATQNRLEKIYRIIESSKFGIHDLSCVTLDEKTKLPRFNMPFELGIFLAAHRFGTNKHKQKICLILEEKEHRYEKFISDLKGMDPKAHENSDKILIKQIRDWLNSAKPTSTILAGEIIIHKRFAEFSKILPKLCKQFGLEIDNIQFNDLSNFITVWIEQNPKKS